MNNLKQLGVAFTQYEQDFDEGLPFNSNSGAGTSPAWLHSTQPYIKNYQVLACPSDANALTNRPGPGLANSSYGINRFNTTGGSYAGPTSQMGGAMVSIASIEKTSSTVQLVESNNFQFYTGGENASTITVPTTNTPRTIVGGGSTTVIERHLDTTNVLWCDGHVKAMKLENLRKVATDSSGIPHPIYFTMAADPE